MHGIAVAGESADGEAGIANLAAKIIQFMRTGQQGIDFDVVPAGPAAGRELDRADAGERTQLRDDLIQRPIHENGCKNPKLHRNVSLGFAHSIRFEGSKVKRMRRNFAKYESEFQCRSRARRECPLPVSLRQSDAIVCEEAARVVSFFARGTHEQRTWIHTQGFGGSGHICLRENSFRRRAFCRWPIVVRGLLRGYSQNLMERKPLLWVWVVLLSGADPGAALICAASCISSAPVAGTVDAHHEMESQPTATHASQHAHHHGAPCVACPGKA